MEIRGLPLHPHLTITRSTASLDLEGPPLASHLGNHVANTNQVVLRAFHPTLGLYTLSLKAVDTCDLVNQDPTLLRLGVDDEPDAALLDDRVSPRPHPRIEEEGHNVLSATLRSVDQVARRSIAVEPATDFNLREPCPLAAERAVGVVKRDVDLRKGGGLAPLGAREDHVFHRFPTEQAGALLA